MKTPIKMIAPAAIAVLVIAGSVTAGLADGKSRSSGHGKSPMMHHAGFSHHGNKHEMAEKLFEKFDLNNNGTISNVEIEGARKAEIAKYDANTDGKLTLNEFEGLWMSLARERMVDHFQRLDSDGDAEITDEEIAKPLNQIMSYLDRNDDGELAKNELRRKHRGWWSKFRGDDDDDDKDDD
jgi:Ca2+-binding EF-hand superfamily protein